MKRILLKLFPIFSLIRHIVSPLKDIRSLSTHKKEPDYSERLPLASSTASAAQKLDPSDDDGSDSNASKPTSNAPLNKKDDQPNNKSQPNDLNKDHDRKSRAWYLFIFKGNISSLI